MTKPLEGITILDATTFLSGPYATLLLAGMGARVIKVEQPKSGDPSRISPPFAGKNGAAAKPLDKEDLSFGMLKRGRNKESITLNLKHEKGKEIFRELAKRVDVVVENFRPGTMDKLGVGYDVLKVLNPGLIYCSLSGFGLSGSYRDLPAFDIVVQAMSGLMSINGMPDSAPVKTGVIMGDLAGGMFSALGILGALRYRDLTGKGQLVETSMLDALLALILDEAPDFWASEGHSVRMGNRLLRLTPFNSYPTLDGYIVIASGNDQHWERLLKAMEREDLMGDSRFNNQPQRTANADGVDAIISAWSSTMTTQDAVNILIQYEVPSGPVRDVIDVLKDQELIKRGTLVDIQHPTAGTIKGFKAWGYPIKFSEAEAGFDQLAPFLGANNKEVYRDLLGLTDAEIEELRANKVI
ncbi:CaiB/BaiF CoA transferase family protein [Paradesulfitobacterium ferrireducens]|uniref:CaiB/BaiF CoA transferase family protein n=1 Tax=Paradesulfitobacterium ferrireducens TaxID=2816476 RepID=UPI001A8FF216|nr:CaiB/BaiF CoA-transferase family protein [Paradesulfitobacterium ferrireducens]